MTRASRDRIEKFIKLEVVDEDEPRTQGPWRTLRRGAEISDCDIDEWNDLKGRFCTGCGEGKLKKHARRSSTKPLKTKRPGESGVGDLMFIKGRG